MSADILLPEELERHDMSEQWMTQGHGIMAELAHVGSLSREILVAYYSALRDNSSAALDMLNS